MPVSRKNRSLKKSLKSKKHFKNVKNYKSKTRKNINKIKGGSDPRECNKSSDCFDKNTAETIKEIMRKYFIDKKKNIKKGSDDEDDIKKNLYQELYKISDKTFYINRETGIKRLNYGYDPKEFNSNVNIILQDYFDNKQN